MKYKSKFDKKKCQRCKYHGKVQGALNGSGIHCYYGVINKKSCLQVQNNKVIDTRGDDFRNCLLLEKGKPKKNTEY